MSSYAAKMGIKTSFMEYLFYLPCYQSDQYGNYDPRLIVQLKKNYRSHEAIIKIPNELFYGGSLEAKAPTGKFLPFSTNTTKF